MAISTDAIILALKNNIDVIIADYDGFPIGRVWHGKSGSTSKIRKRQLEASLGETGLIWIKQWISAKISNQADFLKDLKKNRKAREEYLDEKISRLDEFVNQTEKLKGAVTEDIADTLRGFEGNAGRIYFETLSALLSDEYSFTGRSSRPAKDPFNAFLNYTYGILYSRVEKALIIAGLDPYLGFMHRDDYNQKSLVFDFIEPYRIHAERLVFKLFSAKRINKGHTDEIKNGYTLNDEGKKLLVPEFMKYFEEDKILHKNKHQSRANILQSDAHHFANSLIKD
jgi:CRISPR-associated protein Cas1